MRNLINLEISRKNKACYMSINFKTIKVRNVELSFLKCLNYAMFPRMYVTCKSTFTSKIMFIIQLCDFYKTIMLVKWVKRALFFYGDNCMFCVTVIMCAWPMHT